MRDRAGARAARLERSATRRLDRLAALCGMVLDELAAPQPDFEHLVIRPALERLLRGLVNS